MKKIILFLLLTFKLFSQDELYFDGTLDINLFDTWQDYSKYLFKKRIEKEKEKIFKLKFIFTGKEFLAFQKSTEKPKWKKKIAKEVTYIEPFPKNELESSYIGYKIDGMYYFFYSLMYTAILNKDYEGNSFHVNVFHTAAHNKIMRYSLIYICRMRRKLQKVIEKGEWKEKYIKILDFYEINIISYEAQLQLLKDWFFCPKCRGEINWDKNKCIKCKWVVDEKLDKIKDIRYLEKKIKEGKLLKTMEIYKLSLIIVEE